MKWNQVADGATVELLQNLSIADHEAIMAHRYVYLTEDDVKNFITIVHHKGQQLTFHKEDESLLSHDGERYYCIGITDDVDEAIFKLLP